MEIGVEIPFLHINQVTSIPFCSIEKLLNETSVSKEESFQHMMVQGYPSTAGLVEDVKVREAVGFGQISPQQIAKKYG